jgi:hypothetical protein
MNFYNLLKYPTSVVVALLLLLFYACGSQDKLYEMLEGDWHGVSWVLEDSDRGYDASNVRFSFREDRTYSAELGTRVEEGEYHLANQMLYTHAEDQEEMAVRIQRLTNDTMVMRMNRGGQMELLTLAKDGDDEGEADEVNESDE